MGSACVLRRGARHGCSGWQPEQARCGRPNERHALGQRVMVDAEPIAPGGNRARQLLVAAPSFWQLLGVVLLEDLPISSTSQAGMAAPARDKDHPAPTLDRLHRGAARGRQYAPVLDHYTDTWVLLSAYSTTLGGKKTVNSVSGQIKIECGCCISSLDKSPSCSYKLKYKS
jgi:hypothetical protein